MFFLFTYYYYNFIFIYFFLRKNLFIWNSEHDWKTLIATFRLLTVSLHLGHHDRGIVARNVEYTRVFSPFFRRGEDG